MQHSQAVGTLAVEVGGAGGGVDEQVFLQAG
jgi:hypothetical protein